MEGDPNSSFAISVRGNSMYGRLISDRGVYVLQSRGGRAFVTVPDTASMPHQCFEDGRDQPSSSPALAPKRSLPTTKALGGTGNVDILALYSTAVEGRYDVPLLINNAISSMNASFGTTGVSGSVRVVGYKSVSYSEGTVDVTEMGNIRVAMRDGTGVFSSVPIWKNDLGADLAVMIFDSSHASGTCGRGFILDSTSGDSTLAYSVTGDGCISAFENFSHEVGHNLGGRHDSSVDTATTPYAYSHGFSDTNSPEFRTIMGGLGTCSLSGCNRLNRWSNPSQNYSVGRPLGVSNDSDMKQSLGKV